MKKLFSAILLFLLLLPAVAQEHAGTKPTATGKGFYLGIHGGLPFGVSTFSSFGADRTGAGYSAGLFAGYRFNSVLSLEAEASLGKSSLSARECCIASGYWLGNDGIKYNAPVLGMEGWDYKDLMSVVFFQQYGLQLNVNLLGFSAAASGGRWILEVSPAVSAIGTGATVMSVSDGTAAFDGATDWHLGVGGSVQVGFQVSGVLQIALYSGLTWISGARIDGIPSDVHINNYFWESGLRLGFKL